MQGRELQLPPLGEGLSKLANYKIYVVALENLI